MVTESTPWTQTKFEQLDLGDARLNKRARLLIVCGRPRSGSVALMERADALGNPADWLVRASHNRSLPEGDKLWERASTRCPTNVSYFL
ncbi:hypothetical protein [Trinickia sp.]|uniref:hypothetical protein n=1 Tax=Trinickia sp. TaxID=2571163 RepID=UPI003F7CE987